MKLYSLPNISELTAGRAVKAEVVASEGGRSLVMVNGVPVRADGEYPAGHSLSGRLAATDGGFKIIATDNSAGVSAEKLLQNAGLHESAPQLTAAFKSYGVALNADNLKIAAEIIRQLPEGAKNLELVALMLARRLPLTSMPLLRDYLEGKLKFATLFAALDKTVGGGLQSAWSQGRMMDAMQKLIQAGAAGARDAAKNLAGSVDELVAGLQLQEMLSSQPQGNQEGRIYFQWPLFWHDQDLPDTLEGEAFVPDRKDSDHGFSLRLLVNPPALGHVEVALHQQKTSLWVHFGVAEELIETFRGMFAAVRERLLGGGDYDQIRLTIGRVRLLNNFFSMREETVVAEKTVRIDVRV